MPDRLEPVGELRGDEMRELMASNWWRLTVVLMPPAAGAVAAFVFSESNQVVVFLLVALGLAAAALVGTYFLADSRARAAFVQAWARSRGWTEGEGVWVEEATPLLRDGDRRESADHVYGPLGDAAQGALCHYTYEVRKETTDSQGHTTTDWDSHDFTVLETRVNAPDIPRLSLHPRSFGDNRLFDRIDSALTQDRVVQLESSELEREYKLEVRDSASDLAVRLLFEPTFIVWCLDQAGDEMLFELEDATLVVAIPGHSYDAAQLDGLLEKATAIATRFAEAHAATPSAT